ncbi:hypothetical protein MmTuc01_1230 [Methanosarcina mazei Tuc01]|uniref:Uncharacterized protein n=1 Tax=Methanosarcina mazei Tuc01 TaxID=1236903 RepID=M1P855_METMZ|nr:hypothetical protein MmTuc01_1230 [Methanosarcina mazei Tuc01]
MSITAYFFQVNRFSIPITSPSAMYYVLEIGPLISLILIFSCY